MDRNEARAALDAVAETERKLATEGADYPLWRHAAFGAVMGGIVLSQGIGGIAGSAIFVAAMLGVTWISLDDRRRYGLFVSGFRKGRTLPLALALAAFTALAVILAFRARSAGMGMEVRLAIAAAAFAAAFGASLWWTRIYANELARGRK